MKIHIVLISILIAVFSSINRTFKGQAEFSLPCNTDRSLLLFTRESTGRKLHSELFTVFSDGTKLKNIYGTNGVIRSAKWSPDGSKIAFTSDEDGDDDLYVISTDGQDIHSILQNKFTEGILDWSPNNSTIAFVSNMNGNFDLYSINIDGTNLLNLSNSKGTEIAPQWSPDGSKITFMSQENGIWGIYVVDSDGDHLNKLADGPKVLGIPLWSPDGATIMFGKAIYDSFQLYLADLAHHSLNPLTTEDMKVVPVWDWSPDGTRIFFGILKDGKQILYTANSDGTHMQNVSGEPKFIGTVLWSPTGEQIALALELNSSKTKTFDLYVMQTNGGNPIKIASSVTYNEVDWQPCA